MAEFLNYKVNLTLKDGSILTGTITNVSSSQISLSNAIQSTEPSVTVPNIDILSTNLSDLKVVQLPPDLLKSSKSKQSKTNGSLNAEVYAQPHLLDDAIIFSSSPSTRDLLGYDRKAENSPRGLNSDRSNTHTPPSRQSKIASDASWGKSSGDVRASTDFDFAANLAMFDKQSIFADFRKKDTIDPNNRLVGHNKIESIKNLKTKEKYDNDEMVLDTSKTDNWDNIGKEKSKNFESIAHPISNVTNEKEMNLQPYNFKLINAINFNTVPLSSPVQLLEIERLSVESYGISPAIMAEVCASNLSQLITKDILGGSKRLSNKKNHNLPPLVIMLIGSGRCGSRAFATGRHLSNHGIRVLAFVLQSEESDEEFTSQWKLFENSEGKVITSSVNELLDIVKNQLDTPVELIIDALQGYDDHLEDIFYQKESEEALRSLVNWCNQSSQQNKILSLDIPSGIDGGSGTVQDPSLQLNCRWLVSMGLPITGLIHAYKNGHLEEGETLHYLVDVGIPNKVYSSKGNLRKFDKFWHCAESSIKLQVSKQ